MLESPSATDTKMQLTCFDLSGGIYLQRFYQNQTSAYKAQKRASLKYGAYLRFDMKPVPKTQKSFSSVTSPGSQYCFCPNTSLAVSRCPDCGKPPYTD